MQDYSKLEEIIKDSSRIKYNEPMKNHTTVKIGGNCDVMVLPNSVEEIQKLVEYARKEGIKYYVIGCGSNLLVSDEKIHAMIIKITNKFADVKIEDEKIIAFAGASMPFVAIKARENGLSGMEFACGIPGSIGGGVRMNAGAYGSEIANIVEDITYLNENNERQQQNRHVESSPILKKQRTSITKN